VQFVNTPSGGTNLVMSNSTYNLFDP